MASGRFNLQTAVNQDGAAILNTHAGTITTLNPCGAFVWTGLQRGESVETIAADLASETGEHIETIRMDVAAFIGTLREHRLLS